MADRLIIIGGDAGGISAASYVRQKRTDLDIVAIEQGPWTSYSNCAIPFLISSEIQDPSCFVSQTPQKWRDGFGVDIRMGHRVESIDLSSRIVELRDLARNRTYRLGFDLLHIGTGAKPFMPDIPGINLPHVMGIQNLSDTQKLIQNIEVLYNYKQSLKVVIIGGSYIGLEMAEALSKRGIQVTIVENSSHLLKSIDPDMADIVEAFVKNQGIKVLCNTTVGKINQNSITTDQGLLDADLVLMAIGVVPESSLAIEAGIKIGDQGAIRVDGRQHTSAEGVWAAGDCCESFNLVSRQKDYYPLGTVAAKQARVAGINIGGGYATFPGVVGTVAMKIFGLEIARTGLNETEIKRAGLCAESIKITSTNKAEYLSDVGSIEIKIMAEKTTAKLLGVQLVGYANTAKRIDTAAVALSAGMTLEEVISLDLAYAPQFSTIWDPIALAARKLLAEKFN